MIRTVLSNAQWNGSHLNCQARSVIRDAAETTRRSDQRRGRTLGPTIVRQDCGPIDRASPVQALSPWLIRTGPVNDRGPCTWRDEREGLKEANAPFHLPKNSPECTSRSCGPTDPWLRAEDGVLTNNVDQRGSRSSLPGPAAFRLGPDPSSVWL